MAEQTAPNVWDVEIYLNQSAGPNKNKVSLKVGMNGGPPKKKYKFDVESGDTIRWTSAGRPLDVHWTSVGRPLCRVELGDDEYRMECHKEYVTHFTFPIT